MEALTIHEAAETTGWSPRMLRYVEQAGLVAPARSASGYRLYGAAELQRLRTLKELLARFDLGAVRRGVRGADGAATRSCATRSSGWLEPRPAGPSDVERRRLAALRAGQARGLLAAVA